MPYISPLSGKQTAEIRKQPERDDGFYSLARWRKFRVWFLKRHPLCNECEKSGKTVTAEIADHIKNRMARPDLSYDEENIQALCWSCHSKKTQRERKIIG